MVEGRVAGRMRPFEEQADVTRARWPSKTTRRAEAVFNASARLVSERRRRRRCLQVCDVQAVSANRIRQRSSSVAAEVVSERRRRRCLQVCDVQAVPANRIWQRPASVKERTGAFPKAHLRTISRHAAERTSPSQLTLANPERMRLSRSIPVRRETRHPRRKTPSPARSYAKFEPIEELGAGGMGVVWLVRHRASRKNAP